MAEEKRKPGRPPGSKNKGSKSGGNGDASVSGAGKSSSSGKSGTKGSSSKNGSDSKKTQKKIKSGSRVKDEIWSLIIMSLSVFLIIAMQTGAAGRFGEIISAVLKGSFGLIGYILPYYLLIYGIMLFAKRTAHIGSRSIAFLIIIYLMLVLLNAVRYIEPESFKITIDEIKLVYEAGSESGGLFGMFAGGAIALAIGKPGLCIFSVVVTIISLLLVVDTPISQFLDNAKAKRAERQREREEAELAAMEEEYEEEERMAEERRASAAAPRISAADTQKRTAKAASASEKNSFSIIPKDPPISREPVVVYSSYGGASDAAGSGTVTYDANIDKLSGKAEENAAAAVEAGAAAHDTGYVPGKMSEGQKKIMNYMQDDSIFGGLGSNPQPSYGLEPIEAAQPGYGLDPASVPRRGYGLEPADEDLSIDFESEPNEGEQNEDKQNEGEPQFKWSDYDDSTEDDLEDFSDAACGDFDFSTDGGGLESGAYEGEPWTDISVGTHSEDTQPEASYDEDFRAESQKAEDLRAGYSDNEDFQNFQNLGNSNMESAGSSAAVGAGAVSTGSSAVSAGEIAKAPEQKLTNGQAAAATLKAGELNTKALEKPYVMPPLELLSDKQAKADNFAAESKLKAKAAKLEETLMNFHVDAHVVQVTQGPAVTRYEVHPNVGVKVNSIVRLADDIALNMEAKSIRIEAPIPGKAAVGIEIENDRIEMVTIKDVIDSREFRSSKSKISFAVGRDIAGNAIVGDLKGMPHMLIAGATGSGKSVCINSIIISLLYKARPDEVKLILVDPKVVELGNYNGIPHLLIPVVTEPQKAAAALNWAVAEMNDRYKKFAAEGARDLASYNDLMREKGEKDMVLPQVVIIIDELADLMMAAPSQVEESICRLAQLARAAGMHLIVATQRPSVDVITGVIKANIPSRIAFAVTSQVDSRTILDSGGAEKLVGKGDMLYKPQGTNTPIRVQGNFVSDSEVHRVIEFVKSQALDVEYSDDAMQSVERATSPDVDDDVDELLPEAIEAVVRSGQASVSMLQRRFRIGYNRAARIVDMMESRGIIGPADGSRPRQVLWSEEDLD